MSEDAANLRAEYALVMRYRPPRTAADKRMLDWLYDEGARAVVVLPQVVVADVPRPPERPRGPSQLLLLAGLVALLALAPVRVGAQSFGHVSDVLALARICRHEAGFPPRLRGRWDHGDDCPAIDAVITRVQTTLARSLGRDVPYAEAVDRYSHGRIFDGRRTDAACDVAFLTLDGAEPACWRAGVPWSRRRDAWLALVEHARAIRVGQVTHACEAPPLHWGCGPTQTARGCRDHERAARAGWIRVSCGRTDNTFYVEGPR